jgi:hypothetical protein
MEQRLAAVEENLEQHRSETDAAMEDDLEQMDHLENVERLLRDCRELLETEALADPPKPTTAASDASPTTSTTELAGDASSPTGRLPSLALEMGNHSDDRRVEGEDQSMAA